MPKTKKEDKKEEKKGKGVETVEVNKKDLKNFMDEFKSMKKRLDRVEYSTDYGRLAHYDATHGEEKPPQRYLLSVYENDKEERKIIVGWKTLKDIAFVDPRSGMPRSEQNYLVYFHDGEEMEIHGYKQFSMVRYGETIKCSEVKREVDDKGTVLVLSVPEEANVDVDEVKVDINFVN